MRRKFDEVNIGAFFALESEKFPDVFVKIPGVKMSMKCSCGGDTWNAVNLSVNGPWTVHFCTQTYVRFNCHAKPFTHVMTLLFPAHSEN